MDKEQLKTKIDFNNIQEFISTDIFDRIKKEDYLVDFEGNFIIPLTLLDMKLIEELKNLKARIIELEKVK